MKATKLIINGEEQELSQVYSVDGQIGNVTLTTKTFSISGLSDLTTAQSAYDFFSNGNNPLLKYNNKIYSLVSQEGGNLVFYSSDEADYYYLVLETSNGTVTDIIDDTGYFGDLYLEGLTVLSYGHSTWQDFLDAYDKDAIVYCKASSQSNPGTGNQTRMAFMAFVDINSTTGDLQGVEFQYYRSRSDHNSAANQLDEVYVYKLVPASGGTWTVTQRDTGAKAVAGTGISLGWGSGNMTISNTGVTSVNGDTGAVSVNDTKISSTAPSSPTEGMVWYDTTNDELKVYDGTNWNVTGKEYNAGEGIEIGTVQDYSAMQGPAPSGYHIPQSSEWVSLCGILTTTFSMASDATTMGTYLKMPMAGRRDYSSSSIFSAGSNGCYRSTTAYSADYAYLLDFYSSSLNPQYGDYRADGVSLRCFKDSPIIPTSSWTTLFDGSSIATGAGIFHNTTDGLISISSDGVNWITIQDKNLGATTVYNDGDTLSEANCGYYYQWGNNYGFAWAGNITTSSTQVDASGYGPGNYYESNTFIFGNTNWSSVQNVNLRGGGTGVVTVNNAITNTGVLSINGKTGDVTDFYIVDTLPNASQADTNATYYLSVGNDEYEEWIVVEKESGLMTFNANSEQYIPYEVVFAEPTTLTFNSKTGSGYIQFSGDNISIIYSDAGVVEVIGGGNEGWYYYDENLSEYVYADATSYTFPAGTYLTMYEESYVTGYDAITFSTGATTIKEWAKVGTVTNTKTFYLSSTSDLTTAQAAYDWYNAGKNPIIVYNNDVYVCKGRDPDLLTQIAFWSTTGAIGNDGYEIPIVYLQMLMDTVTRINLSTEGIPSGITNDTTGTTTTVTKIRAGTEAEYNALSTHDTSTIYHIY